ncbi:TPA: hypothetical protein ACIRVE_003189 [Pseudomonas putida]
MQDMEGRTLKGIRKSLLQRLVVGVKKHRLITVLLCLACFSIFAYLIKPQFPSEIVLEQAFIPGQSIYIVQNARDPEEPKKLRFYVYDGGGRSKEAIKVLVAKTPPFLVSDTDVKDVVIQRVANGLHIKLKGAVSDYRSNLYLQDGDTFTTYRVSLEQIETRPPLPSGR